MIPTPHITAKEGDFARTVLMPGDPLRSKFIADNYLENAVLVNNTRQQCPRRAGLHRHLQGQARVRDGVRHGDALHRHLLL